MIYTHNLNPVALSVAGLEIHWYGLMYLANFFLFLYLGWWLYKHFFKTEPALSWNTFENLLFGGFLAGILGGRLGYFLFYSPSTFISDPLQVLQVWNGGMSIHGGVLAVIMYGLVWCRYKRQSFMQLVDTFILPLCLALFLGRLVNFVNGELVGRVNPADWGVIFPHIDNAIRYPSQLFEAAKNLLMAAVFTTLLWRKIRLKPGTFLGLFLLMYGLQRFAIEYIREPNFYVGPLTMGQVLCTIMVFLGAGLLGFLYKPKA